MSSCGLPSLPSLRRQQLHLEFASLRTAPPRGVYVTLSPTDPSLWAGVLFVQKGPYASGILRFQIRFPPTYPDLPPLVTFTTDIFHPLIVPLTTYTFTTGSSDTDTVSATDEERLLPGGFSLRHGFPHWFGRSKRSAEPSRSSSRNVSGNSAISNDVSAGKAASEEAKVGSSSTPTTTTGADAETRPVGGDGDDVSPSPSKVTQSTTADTQIRISTAPSPAAVPRDKAKKDVPIVNLLNYIRSTFDDESVLDSVPLEAAGNPGAWHAWRSHRKGPDSGTAPTGALSPDAKAKRGGPQARPPGEWNWEGVWSKRTQTGINNSFLESVLFGTSARGGTDDLIRFSKLDHELLEKLKEDIFASQKESNA